MEESDREERLKGMGDNIDQVLSGSSPRNREGNGKPGVIQVICVGPLSGLNWLL